jgi:ABC-type phosphate transport system permease subunit
MDSTNIIEILAYTIPSIITGAVPTFYLIPFQRSTKHQTLVVAKDHQAALYRFACIYERMTLFMERINLSQLMVRIVPFRKTKRLS